MSKHELEAEFIIKYGLDARGLSLLAEIGYASCSKQNVTASELMRMVKYGSPATIHRSLINLKNIDLVSDFYEKGDRRKKYLALSQTSESYFSQLARLFFVSQN